MDIFKFNPTGEQTVLERGQFINGIERKLWVERYRDAGEFSFEAPLSSGVRELLPTGTLISQIDSMDVMIVESNEIIEVTDEDPTIIITGRSFVSYLENRIVGANVGRVSPEVLPMVISASTTWEQITTVIVLHIDPDLQVEEGDGIDNVNCDDDDVTLTGTESIERTFSGTVWSAVSDLLPVDDLGIKTVRINPFGLGDDDETRIKIHNGVDRSADILFSWKHGDLSSLNYLTSQKGLKNSAVVVGQYVYVVVDEGPDKYDRRFMHIEAKDIDGHYGSMPSGGDLFDISVKLAIRGLQTLRKQKQISISQADISETTRYQYRRDYNIGDLVTVDGNFDSSAVMRIVEYAEIEDENGVSGHPTLEIPGL